MNKYRIVIADDHEFYLQTLKMVVNSIDECEVIDSAKNGKELLEKIKNKVPDLIFMDIKMPVMDGIETTKKLKYTNKDIKIIAMSIFEEQEYYDKMMEAGADMVIHKDSDRAIIKDTIFKILKNKQLT